MIRLPTAAVGSLRDRLADRGARPSISIATAASADEQLDQMIAELYGPLCDAMYLMMAADGQLTGAERDVIRGALRELDDRIRSRHVEAMIAASHAALATEGWDSRYRALGEAIGEDRTRGEAALLLAAAVAYADDEIVPAENDVMSALMRVLGVSAARMGELVGSLERIDTILDRDSKADAADVVVHAALRLRTPEDYERLAATTDRPDVALALRLYAAYAHSIDDLSDLLSSPRSLTTAAIAALRDLGESLQERRSPRLDELRAGVLDLCSALERLDRAPDLKTARNDGGESSPLVALDLAISRISLFCGKALERLAEPYDHSRVEVDLRDPIDAMLAGKPGAAESLASLAERSLATAAHTVPRAILIAVRLVVRRLGELPIHAPNETPTAPQEKKLPEWMPKARTLGGFYVHRALSEGGAGSVFVASRSEERDDPAAEQYALKVPHYDAVAARSVSESEYMSVFKREAGTLLSLPEHPNLAGFVTFDARARPKPLLVMELVEGVDCLALIKQRSLDGRRVMTILEGVLAGLAAMHEAGIAHLDVKPSNIVLRPSGEPVLVDFGLAGKQIRVGCATPMYAAPEVWGHVEEGVPAHPSAADIYSFGCVIYELISSRILFEAPHVLALLTMHLEHDGEPAPIAALIAGEQTSEIGRLIARCLRKSAKDRPTVAALQEELRGKRAAFEALSWPVA